MKPTVAAILAIVPASVSCTLTENVLAGGFTGLLKCLAQGY